MRISHEHRFIFFAWPKTGSRTVRKLLDPHSEIRGRPAREISEDFPFYNHVRPVELREVFRTREWDFDAYFKFVVVRNPWSRLVSVYEMDAYRRGGVLSRLRTRRSRYGGFRAWLEDLPQDAEKNVPMSVIRRGTLSYLGFVGDEDGIPLVDATVKLEEIDTGLPPLLQQMGLPVPQRISRKGRGRYRSPYREYYDEASRDLVARRYEEEIRRFGYEF